MISKFISSVIIAGPSGCGRTQVIARNQHGVMAPFLVDRYPSEVGETEADGALTPDWVGR